jgi:hypothetical protein
VGVKPVLISREISANGVSGNQHKLLGVPAVGLELLLMRLVLIEKTTFEKFFLRISIDLLESLLTLYFSLHFFF